MLLKWCFRLKLFLHPRFQELNQVGAAGCFRNCCRNMNTYRAAAGTGSCQSPVLSASNMQLAERAVGSLLPLCSLFASRCCIGPGCSHQHQAPCLYLQGADQERSWGCVRVVSLGSLELLKDEPEMGTLQLMPTGLYETFHKLTHPSTS